MILSACLIVKDDSEAPKLHNALNSIAQYFDNIYITATGKEVDKIKKISYLYKAHYSYFKWNKNFSDARNFNFSQVSDDTDYIFWMDTDDVLIGGEHLRDTAQLAKENGKDVVFFTYWYGCRFDGEPTPQNFVQVELEQMRERLIKPGTISWKGRLHETPVPVNGAKHTYTQYPFDQEKRPIVVMHTATIDDAKAKMERNKKILELQLEEEQEKDTADPRTLLYLMKIYSEEGTDEECRKVIKMGEEYLTKSGWDEERGVCYEQMGIAYGRLGNNKKAIEMFSNAIREWPHQILFYIRLASAYYDNKNYKACRHFLDLASGMDFEKRYTAGMQNVHAMKVLFAELLMKLNYNQDAGRDTEKALEAAKMLYKELPSEENKNTLLFIEDQHELNKACRNTHLLADYLDSIGESYRIPLILNQLPDAISKQPFAINLRKAFTPPRKWKENEICYFANFGGNHFEKWDGSSLEKGVGGSETAVIELSREWVKLGYKVTVYGDPIEKGERDGVTYLPWYYFNKNDNFNIFIQWRGWQLAGKVKCKKFYVDLHDIYSTVDMSKEQIRNIDKIFVKSNYHRQLGLSVPDEKFAIISNGIEV